MNNTNQSINFIFLSLGYFVPEKENAEKSKPLCPLIPNGLGMSNAILNLSNGIFLVP